MELERLRRDGPDEDEVDAARRQVRGGVVMDHESISARMFQLASEEIYRGGYAPLEEQVGRVMQVTRDQVVEAARRYLRPSGFALTALGPAPGGPLGAADWPVEG
jgi:predicted Zn-dependent peptidase